MEQTIGRGLRPPYGKRTGVESVDTLSIVAHDKFQEIIDEANRPDSMLKIKSIVLDPTDLNKRPRTVVAQPTIERMLGIEPTNIRIVMLEPKARNQMDDSDVLAKRDAAVTWCRQATAHSQVSHGKPWAYCLIPHDAIAENWNASDLIDRWAVD